MRYSIEKFQEFRALKSIHVVIDPSHAQFYQQCAGDLGLPAPISGSDTRNKSINNALANISHLKDDDIVLIHDAARPNISTESIQGLLEAMEVCDAASLGIPVTDTLRRATEEMAADQPVSRDGLWAMQTPQAFRCGILKKAHEAGRGKIFTDDAGMVSSIGIPVKIVAGSRSNIKITGPEDLVLLEKIMQPQSEIRTGMGFDVHAFSKEKGRKLILCGVEISHPYGLEGHSDADAALHALTDALLGAAGEGDIGLRFPPSNPKFKNMDSRIFLEDACGIIAAQRGVILNADVTIICESPKISPYRDRMRARVAEILKIDPARVNIKATTTEGLGFTGRGEGVAAQAIASVKYEAA